MKDIAGLEGRYAITEDGRVWSYPKKSGNSRLGLWLKPVRTVKGYLLVCLVSKTCQFNQRIHRLVAMAFIPNPLGLPEVNHKNGIKTDNSVSNLEWCTTRDNAKHYHRLKRLSREELPCS